MTKICLKETDTAADARHGICSDPRTTRIRELNDSFRRTFGANRDNKPDMYFTRGVSAFGENFVFDAMTKVVAFDKFTEENDPYCEHDFAVFKLHGEDLIWKIDYFEAGSDYRQGSKDPSDEEKTVRTITIMLAEEY